MKFLITLAMMTVATLVYADNTTPKFNKYDSTYSDCVDYGHGTVSDEKKAECHDAAKAEVLSTFKAYQDYLDCVDYGHSDVSAEQEISCLKQIN